jgi:hypothetical protein
VISGVFDAPDSVAAAMAYRACFVDGTRLTHPLHTGEGGIGMAQNIPSGTKNSRLKPLPQEQESAPARGGAEDGEDHA